MLAILPTFSQLSRAKANVGPMTNVYWGNMDEFGITVIQKPSKILALKGKCQVGTITSLERGQNITIICSMNAIGSFVPPGFIFPRVRMKVELRDAAPPQSMFACQVSNFFFV